MRSHWECRACGSEGRRGSCTFGVLADNLCGGDGMYSEDCVIQLV